MAFAFHAGYLTNLVGGVLVVALGLFVASVKPRRAANLRFASWAVVFGLAFSLSNVFGLLDPENPWGKAATDISSVLNVAAALLMLYLAPLFPRPMDASERRLLWGALLLFGAHVVVITGVALAIGGSVLAASLPFAYGYTQAILTGSLWSLLVLLALRFRTAPDSHARRQHAVASAALLVYPGLLVGVFSMGGGSPINPPLGWLGLAEAGLLFVLWIRNTGRPDGAVARNVALASLAVPLAGMVLWGLLGGTIAVDAAGTYGIVRTIAVAILAYGVIRHQLLDLDVKIRWTINKGTLAAVFLAVFFIVSNVAQNVLGQAMGLFAGGVASGLLFFALVPLQRVAERVANAAVPTSRGLRALPHADRVALYRDQLQLAWRDGTVDKGERALLIQLRERLGLSTDEAEQMEREITTV